MRYAALSLTLAAALLAGACARSNSTPPAQEAPSAVGLAPVAWTPQASPDSIAAWANAGCPAGPERMKCLEGALLRVIEPAGVGRAMDALLVLAAGDAEVKREGHVFAHGIGIAAYRTPETVGETFARCTEDFQSGCYHGVIQAYFADSRAGGAGVNAEKLNTLCAPYREGQRWLSFQCAHGMGHGLMAVNRHHLLRALDGCDLLSSRYERESCYGGAFMENIINVTNPHHTATTHGEGDGDHHAAGHDAHGGAKPADAHAAHGAAPGDSAAKHADGPAGHGGDHAHGAQIAAADEPFKALDRDQPLYPCTIVKEAHRMACYQMQTSAVLHFNEGDFAAAAKVCETAPEDMHRICFISLGRDANAWAQGRYDGVIGRCSQAAAARQPWCYVGAVKNMMDITANPDDGLKFCREVPGPSKAACYRAVGQHAYLVRPSPEEREKVCAAAASYVAECRKGALLPLVRTG